ncbi:phosphatidylserine decarboxylase family protein [Aliifodinibius sp. S!AR15-10]|uniref:phosphatidylserine decarboxylase family protein n=1 Tax=Aliifodinibius sp. S!AR15-10 TaxID=2950437 RepID=UPI00285F7C02|nr:phosphatidylserine decarboxylase family protein [Aliifodinibius sp. S!AR15-10]MDR8392343.1 phosphatidylserine decarboxylase family protein [Aliifodinibius sp. S!AR15-10]
MLARDGYPTISIVIVFAGLVSLAASYFDHWTVYLVYGLMVALVGLILNFFRDPDRDIPSDDNLVLAPADGKVVLVDEVEEHTYIKGKATQISIFLSVVDVHVNRNPISGTLEYLEYHPGEYHMAWDHQASELNERADFGVRHTSGWKVFYRQITGFLARRIVYNVNEGEQLQAGKRFGMMKFGSRMDILVPPEVEVLVQQGDKTVAGETVLGRFVDSHSSPVSGKKDRAEISNT